MGIISLLDFPSRGKKENSEIFKYLFGKKLIFVFFIFVFQVAIFLMLIKFLLLFYLPRKLQVCQLGIRLPHKRFLIMNNYQINYDPKMYTPK